ncbi:MAG: AAA family ATPase [Chloroflexota bacterium]|nr:AAA family ATPase [Chloroflexota bacterium]
MQPGQIIFLNGTSSAGKTTIARALQDTLEAAYMRASLDDFFNFYPEKLVMPKTKEKAQVFRRVIPNLVSGFHRAIGALAGAGNNVIVDHVLQGEGWLDECLDALRDYDVLFVGVRCPLAVLEQREKDRGDRSIGLARAQFEQVHRHGLYDLELDTSVLSVKDCVAEILAVLDSNKEISAFERLGESRMG